MPTNHVCLWFPLMSLGGWVGCSGNLTCHLGSDPAKLRDTLGRESCRRAAHASSCQIEQAEAQAEHLPRLRGRAVAPCEDTGALPMAQRLHPGRSPYPPAWGQGFNAIKKDL